MKFTTATVARLAIDPGRGDRREFDDDLVGFGIRLRATGGKSWIIQYRNRAGKSQTKTLGPLNKLSLAQARQLAKQDLARVALHGDPQQQKKQERARAAQTLDSIAAGFLEYQRAHLKPQSFDQVETHLKKHWQPLGGKSIHDITALDVSKLVGQIAKERGPYAANRARATLSSFYGWAMGEGVAAHNPVAGVKRRAKETPRDRLLSDAEVCNVWRACRNDDHGFITRLLILTGARRDEVGNLRRSEISIADRRWSLPAARSKNNRAHSIWLSDPAIAILTAAINRPGREDREAIFGEGNSGRGFSGWSKCKERLDARIAEASGAKPADWRLHDLRRGTASGMQRLGVRVEVIERALNHVSGVFRGVAGVYQRDPMADEVRAAFARWSAHVERITTGAPASNVVAIKSA